MNFGLILLSALFFGVIFGYILKLIWNSGLVDVAVAVNYSLEWIDILQSVFLSALELLIVPLVLVSIIRSLLKAGSGADASKSAATILAVLLGTCALAALTGYCVVRLFGIGAADFTFARPTALTPTSIIRTVKSIVPSNLFNAIGRNSVLPVVFLAAIFGAAALTVKKTIPEYGSKLETAVEIAYKLIGTVVDFVVDFTPFGILSLVTVNIATNDWTLLVSLGKFIVAFYAGAVIVAAIHVCILLIFRVKVTEYFKKS
ncbi:MAG: cation:dicarboxylase symporter family transporter, partial [Spirochaetaceae bacterium]|nr:cation:dicarboxylase symporter family transporter [Spirochaetaceae bacterium]